MNDRSIASIAAQLALSLPESFDYTNTRCPVGHEDFTGLLAAFAVVVEKWARGRSFGNWYELVDAFAAAFAVHYPDAVQGYVSTREWQTVIEETLITVHAEDVE